jgi:hypothetical protein
MHVRAKALEFAASPSRERAAPTVRAITMVAVPSP